MNKVRVREVVLGEGTPKICIPVMGKNDAEICAQAQQALDAGAQLIEWRADFGENVPDTEALYAILSQLRAILKCVPLLFTFRTAAEGGARCIKPEDYSDLNCRAVQSGLVDMVDVEISQPAAVVQKIIDCAHQKMAAVLASSHDFAKTPPASALMAILQKMQDMQADVLKIAVMPKDVADVLNLLTVTSQCQAQGIVQPVVTMSMGDLGSITRVCGEYFGSAMTFGATKAASAPGQFEAGKLRQVLDILHEKASEILPHEKALSAQSAGHIFLIGFMGTGKSSVASRLAKEHGLLLMEMDEEIVRREGKSIPEIFAMSGESCFRDLETALLKDIARQTTAPMVVSCGGGIVLRPENTALMKQCGRVVLLTASAQTVFERIGGDKNRPNIKDKQSPEAIQALMDVRRQYYEAAADTVLATDNLTTADICQALRELGYV